MEFGGTEPERRREKRERKESRSERTRGTEGEPEGPKVGGRESELGACQKEQDEHVAQGELRGRQPEDQETEEAVKAARPTSNFKATEDRQGHGAASLSHLTEPRSQ